VLRRNGGGVIRGGSHSTKQPDMKLFAESDKEEFRILVVVICLKVCSARPPVAQVDKTLRRRTEANAPATMT